MAGALSNRILEIISGQTECLTFLRQLTSVDLHVGELLSTPNVPMKHVYFVNSGLVSLLVTTRAGDSISAAIIGPEGFVGMPLALGEGALPVGARVQIPGTAYRASAHAFRVTLNLCPILQSLTLQYTLAQLNDAMLAIACSRYHSMEQRFAMTLLKISDRLGHDFKITHEIMAQMLGSRRATITLAAEEFQKRHLIIYKYGHLSVLNRPFIEELACECYETHRLSFARFSKML